MFSAQQIRGGMAAGVLIALLLGFVLTSCASKTPTTTDRVVEKLEQAQARTIPEEHHELVPRHTVDENGESNVEFVLRRTKLPNTIHRRRGKSQCKLVIQKLTCVYGN
jgi:hypothetical protein